MAAAPSDGRLSDAVGWQETQARGLGIDLARAARERWTARWCQAAPMTAETEAACARQAGAATPATARAALATQLGDETERLLALPTGADDADDRR